jgi:hypothetical protein
MHTSFYKFLDNFIPKAVYLHYVLSYNNIQVRFEISNPCNCEYFLSVLVYSLIMAIFGRNL